MSLQQAIRNRYKLLYSLGMAKTEGGFVFSGVKISLNAIRTSSNGEWISIFKDLEKKIEAEKKRLNESQQTIGIELIHHESNVGFKEKYAEYVACKNNKIYNNVHLVFNRSNGIYTVTFQVADKSITDYGNLQIII